MDLEKLNSKYKILSPEERIKEVYRDFKNVLFTSSFGTSSALLLHLFKRIKPEQEVLFLDTTYHFPETLAYKEQLTDQLKLNVRSLLPEEWRNKFTKEDETWKKDPDLCCSINKVEPLNKVKANHDVWVSGLMAWQTPHRKQLQVFEKSNDIIKFHPIIDITEDDMKKYLAINNLPEHPLQKEGYSSVGCTHCTAKGQGRQGRWVDKSKDECGLHL
jgi:phosphoadenosine phosphosulfate reductase